jgi:DNA-binding protein YbaB
VTGPEANGGRVTGPARDAAAGLRSSAVLRSQVEELAAAYERIRGETRRVHERMASVTGQAESTDGMVSAKVGPRGHLLSLTLDPRASRRVSTEELSAAIVETVNRAAKEATARAGALLAAILPGGVPVTDLMEGTADPLRWQPDEPLTESAFEAWLARLKHPQPRETRS